MRRDWAIMTTETRVRIRMLVLGYTTKRQLAQQVGCTFEAINHAFQGRGMHDRLVRIAEVLMVSLASITDGDPHELLYPPAQTIGYEVEPPGDGLPK